MNNKQYRRFALAAALLPLAGTIVAGALLMAGHVTMIDLGIFLAMYGLAGVGVTVGYHRLLAHRAFVCPRWLRVVLTAAGSIAAQGPSIVWVAHHRRHHRLTDRDGDPHSPYVDSQGMEIGGWRGFWHAHLGWLVSGDITADHLRYCPDLVRDPIQRWMSRNFVMLSLAGVVVPGMAGYLISGTLVGGATGMLWGGLVRMFVGNQVTFAINSACHLFGRKPFATPDESRNLALLALATFGESWHNNHHALPRSARFATRWWQLDPGGAVVSVLERLRLATAVVRFNDAAVRERADTLQRGGGGRRGRVEPPPPLAGAETTAAQPVAAPTQVE